MKNIENFLTNTPLFKEIAPEVIASFSLSPYMVSQYQKDEVVALEDDNCTRVGIVLYGSIEVKKISPSGKAVIITTLSSGDFFGEVIIFSNKDTYPSTLVATALTKVIYFDNEEIIKLCTLNTQFLKNLLSLFSNKILMLNEKINLLSHQSIRHKVTHFLLQNYKKQKSLKIKLSGSKSQISEKLGVPRPSFSRELMLLKEKGIIDYDQKYIYIKDIIALEDCLL